MRDREKTGRAQDHGHDAQTAGRKIQRMIAAMTADVGIVRIQDTRIFPSMDHWTCLQPSDASATAVTAPIWQCVVETGCSLGDKREIPDFGLGHEMGISGFLRRPRSR